MNTIPAWIGALGMIIVIAAALGAAVAVYRTNVQATSLREAERTMDRLRGEIGDYERREKDLESTVKVLEVNSQTCASRCSVLEDLLLKREGDEEIRSEIAAVRKAVDENVLAQLSAIVRLLERRTT